MAVQDPARFWSGYQEQNPMDYVDPLGGRSLNSMMGGDAFSQQLIEDMMMGRGDQYSPGGLNAPMFPEDQPIDPQDFIGMQLAGDVTPLVRPGPYQPPTPKIYSQGARGMDAIQNFQSVGGQHAPDLMNIYNILTGREVGR